MPYRQVRTTQTPTKVELNWRAIPELARGGWRLCTVEEVAVTGTVEKKFLVFGADKDPTSEANVGFIAKKAKRSGDLECVTEEPDSNPPDIRFMSKNFVRRQCEQLVHGAELVANYVGAPTVEAMGEMFQLDDKAAERKFYTVDAIFEVLLCVGRSAEERKHFLDARMNFNSQSRPS